MAVSIQGAQMNANQAKKEWLHNARELLKLSRKKTLDDLQAKRITWLKTNMKKMEAIVAGK